MNNESDNLSGFRRFIERFKMAKLLLFTLPLFAALIVFQIVVRRVAHELPPSARSLWVLVAKPLYAAAMLWLYALEVRYFERRPISELARQRGASQVAAGVAVGFALFSSVLALLYLGGYVHHVQFGGFAGLPAVASASLGAAIGEELVFRGGIFRITEDWLGTTPALVISAVLFGAAHALNPSATPVGVIAVGLEAGVLLGAAYSATRSLWLPIGMHFGWDFTEGGVFVTAVPGGQSHGLITMTLDGPTFLTGGASLPDASIFAIALCLIAATILCIRSVRRGYWRPFSSARR